MSENENKDCPYVTGNVTRYCTLTPFTLTDEMHGRRWIPVTERLPDYGQRVMTAHALIGLISIGTREQAGTRHFWVDESDELNDPTHWMKLPEPPVE